MLSHKTKLKCDGEKQRKEQFLQTTHKLNYHQGRVKRFKLLHRPGIPNNLG